MLFTPKQKIIAFGLFLMLILFFILNLSIGSVQIGFKEVVSILVSQESEKESWRYIILNYRLPKAIVAILVGMALSISGMLMQTLFKNPMADPYVLGLSSGSSLGVALVVLGGGLFPLAVKQYFTSSLALVLASVLGSLLVLFIILLVSRKVRDTMTLLIVGLMFGSFAGALVGVLSYFSSAEELKKFTFWSLGSLGNLTWQNILVMFLSILVGLLLSFRYLKTLNALLLGENYAQSLGVNIKRSRVLIILATAILSGTCTAFAGPIAFVGLAIPHITKMIFKSSNHFCLFFGNLLLGAIILLVCDSVCQLPGDSFILPINAITSIVGAPIVIYLLLRKQGFRA